MKFCPTCKSKFPTDINYCPNDATKLVSDPEAGPSHSLIGMILDNRYRIISKLGEGGMGSVYASEHILLKKNVAIKVLRYDLARKEDVVRRFQNEAIAASRIGHENIIEVTDFGRTPDGSVYFVMEHLNGLALSDVIQKSGSIPLRRAIPILLQITKALSAAHSQGIIHRDLKPENIILIDKADRKDFVKILDFGISKMLDTSDRAEKLTAMGMIVGTPEYMSPEQAAGMSVDKRTDIYSLGVIMYEMMTGRLPFLADNAIRILMMHQTEKPARPRDINPDIHIGMEQIILKCMEKKPEDRYQDMSEITHSLIQLLSVSSKPSEPKKTIAFNPQAVSSSQISPSNPSLISQIPEPAVVNSSNVSASQEISVNPIPLSEKPSPVRNTDMMSNNAVPAVNSKKTISGEIQNTNMPEIVDVDIETVGTNKTLSSVVSEVSLSESLDKTPVEKIDRPIKSQTKISQEIVAYDIGETIKAGSSGNKKLWVAVIIVLLILVAGGGVYYFLNTNKSSEISSTIKQSEEKSTEIKAGEMVSLETKGKEIKDDKREEEALAKPEQVEEKVKEEKKSIPDREIKMAKISDTVVLSLVSEPDNVEIYKGGIMVGVTPYQLKGKKNTSNEFIFKKAGYEPLKKKIVFMSSGEMKINLKKIEEKKPSNKKDKDPFEKIDDLKDLSF